MEEEIKQESINKEADKDCPQCGGTMQFDPINGGLFCPYCEYHEIIENIGTAMEQDLNGAVNLQGFDWGIEKKHVICRSCGAESVYDVLETSSVCPFCGANQVMETSAPNSIPPNGIIPFQISQEQARQSFKKWLKKKWFTPRAAKKQASPSAFKGIYLPYWTFDSITDSNFSAQYGIDHVYRDRDGHTHTQTNWYPTSGSFQKFFNDELVIASKRHQKDILKRVEPFDTDSSRPFRPEYLSGFISERYSVGLQEGWSTAQNQMTHKLEDEITAQIKRDYHANHVRGLSFQTAYSNMTYKYVLLPLWQSAFTYKQKLYQFMVNGQNGKTGGKAPISLLRIIFAILIALIIIASIVFLAKR